MATEKEVVGHGSIFVGKYFMASFTDGTNIYRLIPYTTENNNIMFEVVKENIYNQELKENLKKTVKALNEADPIMILRYRKGKWIGAKGDKKYIAFKWFNKLLIFEFNHFYKVFDQHIRSEINRVSKQFNRLKYKMESLH